MKPIKVFALIALFFSISSFKPTDDLKWLGWDEGYKLAQKKRKIVMIDCYTEWCGWCKRMDKDTYANDKVQTSLEQFVCVKIDAEQNRDLAKTYKINGFPSTVFLKANGQLIEVIPGYLPPSDFLKLLDNMLSKSE